MIAALDRVAHAVACRHHASIGGHVRRALDEARVLVVPFGHVVAVGAVQMLPHRVVRLVMVVLVVREIRVVCRSAVAAFHNFFVAEILVVLIVVIVVVVTFVVAVFIVVFIFVFVNYFRVLIFMILVAFVFRSVGV